MVISSIIKFLNILWKILSYKILSHTTKWHVNMQARLKEDPEA